MKRNVLNVTNGTYFNEYFLRRFGGEALPFCEAMMDGDTTLGIYSEEFIRVRAESLSVSMEEYRSKMQVYDALKEKRYDELRLWFGKDTFCQTNLLTLLAYLEEASFGGSVVLNYVDDESCEILESDIAVHLGQYRAVYEDVLIRKKLPQEIGVLSSDGIKRYFDYHSENGFLASLVKENPQMEKMPLLCKLLENSTEYGLSDRQAERLIDLYGVGGER